MFQKFFCLGLFLSFFYPFRCHAPFVEFHRSKWHFGKPAVLSLFLRMFFGPRVYKGLKQVEVCFLKKITLREASAEQTGELYLCMSQHILLLFARDFFFFSLVDGSYSHQVIKHSL